LATARPRDGVDFAFEMAGAIPALALAYAVGRRGSTTCAGLPPHTATFRLPSSALVADERVIKGSYMGSAVPTRDIPDYVDKLLAGKLPVDRLLTDQPQRRLRPPRRRHRRPPDPRVHRLRPCARSAAFTPTDSGRA